MRASVKFVSFCLGFCSADISLVLDGKLPIHSILEDFLNSDHAAPLRKVLTELRMREERAMTSHTTVIHFTHKTTSDT